MNDIMSEDQIAALFEAAKSGEVPDQTPQPVRRRQRTRTVDFSRPTKFTADHQRRIERTVDAFCLGAAGRLTAELRMTVEFEVLNTTQVTWAAAQTLLPLNSLAATVLLQPLGTRVLMSIESQFILTMIEGMLGGTANRAAKPRRFTEIDWTLSRRIVDVMVHHFSAAWHDMTGTISFEVETLEEQTDATSISPVSEPTLVVMIEARVASQSAAIGFLIPWSAIDPIADLIAGKDEAQSGLRDGAFGIDLAMAAAPVTIRAEVAALQLPVADILSLQPGSVIRLGAPAADGVSIYAENVKLARAKPGANGVRRAVQIEYYEPEGDADGW